VRRRRQKHEIRPPAIRRPEDLRGFHPPPQVEEAILYGSRAKGNYQNGSDIDLTLRGGPDLTLNVIYKILNDLDELLLPYTIDLSIFDDISDPDVIGHIQRVGITFYRKGETIPEPTNR
jgi:predicted nucleotidyltransferase